MELKYKVGFTILTLLLLVIFSSAVSQKVFVDTNYNLNDLYNITNLTALSIDAEVINATNVTAASMSINNVRVATITDLTSATNLTITSSVLVRNTQGVIVNIGDPVYFSGWNAGQGAPEIKIANNTATLTHVDCIVAESISNNANGDCIVSGIVQSMDTSRFSANDELYLSDTGNFTATKPLSAVCIQNIGQVLRSHATLGTMFVSGANRCNDVPKDVVITGDANGTGAWFTTIESSGLTTASEFSGAHNWSDNQFYPTYCTGGTWLYGVNDSNPCSAPTAADIDPGTFPSGNYVFNGVITLPYVTGTTMNSTNFYQGGNIVLDSSDESGLDVNSADLWDGLNVPTDLNNKLTLDGSNITTGTIDDARLSFTLQDAVTDGGCTDCITETMVDEDGTGTCASSKICTGGHTHPASEVTTGTFGSGNYIFPDNVSINNYLNMTTGEIINVGTITLVDNGIISGNSTCMIFTSPGGTGTLELCD